MPTWDRARADGERERRVGKEARLGQRKKEKGGGMDREGQAQEHKRQEGVGDAANALIIFSREKLDLGDRILAWQGRWAER